MIKGEGSGPSEAELRNTFSSGGPARPTTSGPNYAAVLGQGGSGAKSGGLEWSGVSVHDDATPGSTAGANIRELERTGGRSGQGVAIPGSTGSAEIGTILQRLTTMQQNELVELQTKLFQAGYYGKSAKAEDVRFGVNDSATTKAFTELLKDTASTAGDKTWGQVLGEQAGLKSALAGQANEAAAAASAAAAKAAHDQAVMSAESAYRSANSPEARARVQKVLDELNANAPSLVEHFDPQKEIQHLDPERARSALTSAFKDAVGRAPSASELSTFVANYDSAARSHPVVTQSDRNAAGVITSSQSGGVDSEPIAKALYANNPEYASYQAVAKYFPAVESVLAGKDLTTL